MNVRLNWSGAPCRFDSTSSSRGMCIFPCRCTKGCDQVTGQCLDDGQCNDGHPSGYNWRGTACQIGNVALEKDTTQSAAKWGDKGPGALQESVSSTVRSKDVAGTERSGAALSHVTESVLIYTAERTVATWGDQTCQRFEATAVGFETGFSRLRVRPSNRYAIAPHKHEDDNEEEEEEQDDEAEECKAGYFGWRCRFQCHKCSTCDSITGKCPTTCQDDRWGVGCMLSNNCSYDDVKGVHYIGRQNNQGSRTCIDWTRHNKITDSEFPDGSRAAAKNYCRNPDADERPWCYKNTDRNWFFCDVNKCDCDSRRFGVNCEKECHCKNVDENCQSNTPKGGCQSGCAPHFTGPTCQECKDGHFGVYCDATCHCSSGSCSKTTGHCPRGCASGWAGDSCHIIDERLNAFTLSVGNSSDIEDHSQCASHNGAVAAGATVNESCTATGRYLSFRRSGGGDNHLTTLCEVVVIGYRYVSCQHCPSTNTCNDVIGCDACAPGKQQPDCVRDCDDGNYGINCNESCGHCKKQSKCSITNGNCPSGCEPWYISDACKTYIVVPGFHSSVKPHVDNVTTTSATVTWPKASNISTGLEGHYLYILWLQADGVSEQNTAVVGRGAGEQLIEARITGLKVNTNYSLRVQPYRQLNVEREGGMSTVVVKFKTRCPALSAVIESVTTTTPGLTANASIVVIWKVITESGCDAVAAIRVEYKQQKTDSWKSVEADRVSQTYTIIRDNLSYEQYEVRLVVTTNENIASTSASKFVDLRTYQGAAALWTGATIGIAVGTFLLGMVTMTVFLLGIL
ncbi:hypothetical protein LSAT2_026310 [Lamellibrachia satsuma]|nr:hypothetical protein LSAT2_026310 [Lamellibrachia satsuma]